MNKTTRVRIVYDAMSFNANIFFYNEIMNGGIKILYFEGREIIAKDYNQHADEQPEPSFSIPKDMLPALQEALGGLGIESVVESHTKGELKATKEHLGDMRRLVFDEEDNKNKEPDKGLNTSGLII